ncbi:expression site-associated gene (ESAG) protein, putative [Trypanosoma brucei brucei TREU927]|uniref:Expression site-associated gene (ESAG) protein, putative n=2 Tax=Trypanosoma brucei TaxID=5691 RepID=Q580E8_TRYB2|nr:expression site-associated gene (ESAG) protein, putative [Trypanosoma brucei brucei TREU927]AAX80903.1 expression site-associated gene (ESAG) protein, putative [Trypanosoma brucei]AAZ10711.1 expression site-associated gene (ESAG) protein, putative [Trypanosoma brucei brucei TREU927]
MKVKIIEWLVFLSFVIYTEGAEDEGRCRLVDDHSFKNLHESVCYLSCLSDALNKLYTNGERKLLVNEEVYANASRILDDMEGRAGESVKYLSVISDAMGGKHDKLEKLISYGNTMGDLVAKVGGLFADVNESVRVVRELLPTALMEANRYYTASAEITRTVWDDVKAVEGSDEEAAKCKGENIGVTEFPTTCGNHTCPLRDNVSDDTLQKYKDGCLEINVLKTPGYVSECLNRPRNKLYMDGAVNNLSDTIKWRGESRDGAIFFQLTVQVQNVFGPLIGPFSAGQPPPVLLEVMSNITSLHSHFNKVHNNFTSLLFDIDVAGNVTTANSSI